MRPDDGVSAVLVAIFIVLLIVPVAAVSIDLSNAFSNRRQMQNAADAAAQAGAQTMNKVRLGTISASSAGQTLDDDVRKVAAENDADTSSPDYWCKVAKVTYNPLGVTVGPSCASWNGDTTAYNAVRVHTARTVRTFFARAIGSSSTAAGAVATATIQTVDASAFGDTQFALCVNAYDTHGNTDTVSTDPPPILFGPDGSGAYTFNKGQQPPTPTALNAEYMVWSNGSSSSAVSNVSQCQMQNAAFKGLICGAYVPSASTPDCVEPIPTLAQWLEVKDGAHVGPTEVQVAGYTTCDPADLPTSGGSSSTTVDFTQCAMPVPICLPADDPSLPPQPAGAQHPLLYCVKYGLFLLSPGTADPNNQSCDPTPGTAQKHICAEFLGEVEVGSGAKATGSPTSTSDPVRIALVQ